MRTHIGVVTMALHLLDAHKLAADTEDVAMKAFELAPTWFCWKKYPDQINLEMVRVSLSDAKKEVAGGLVDGSGRTGWTLTDVGRQWALVEGETFLSDDLIRLRADARGGGIDEQRWRNERSRLRGLSAWASWSGAKEVTLGEAEEVFRLDAYTVGRLATRKLARLTALFEADDEIAPFIEASAQIIRDHRGQDQDHE